MGDVSPTAPSSAPSSDITYSPGTGTIEAGGRLEDRMGTIAREDVAEVIAACFELGDETIGRTIEILEGSVPILEALQNQGS